MADVGTANLEAVSGSSTDNLLAVSWAGSFPLEDGAWSAIAIDGGPRFNDVWFNGDVGWAVGEDGAIGQFRNGVWTVTTHESRARLYGISATGAQQAWAVGENGTFLQYDGITWTALDTGTTLSLWGVVALSPTNVWVAGNNGTILQFDGTGFRASNSGVDNNLYAIVAAPSGLLWAIGNRGMALRQLAP